MLDLSRTVPRNGSATPDLGTFGLSVAQSELWLAQQLHPTVPFSVSQYTDLHGPLDRELLQQCTQRAGRELQSPDLRFVVVGGRPRQYVDHDLQARFDCVDVSDHPDPDHAAQVRMSQDRQAGIDLLGPDVSRTVLFTLGPDRHRWYARSHHIAVDGFGAAQLLQRTAELYSAAIEGRPAPPCRAVPLTEIVAAERRYRSAPRFVADREYWGAQLAGLNHVTRLKDRYAAPSAWPHVTHATVAPEAMAQLDAAAGRYGTGMTEVLVAAVMGFLARMTGDSDVTVSLPVAARTTGGLRRSAGMVSNVVPLRVRGVADRTVGDLVRQVRMGIIGALRHQLYRHEDLLRDHGPGLAGRSGYGPLINVLTLPDSIGFGAARGRAHLLSAGPVEDLTVNCFRFGAEPFSIDFHGNPALYRADELDRYRQQFMDWLSRFLWAAAEEKVFAIVAGERSIAGPQHRHRPRLLPELLATGIGGGERIALSGQGRSVSYRELDELSAQWARELIAHGAGPERVVAVALTRSVESVIALWAVARAGAVFFPVNPTDPPARVARLIADSQAALGITLAEWRAPLLGTTVDWLVLDSDEFTRAAASHPVDTVTDAERLRPLRAAHPAYLIYTSGSTGEPKGVLSTHAGLTALSDELRTRGRIHPESVVLLAHSPYCDASMLEYLSAFASGAKLVVLSPDIVAGERLSQVIEHDAITHLNVTPTILATLDPHRLPSLQTVTVGGDKCPPALVDRWATGVPMFNSYGPTEATVVVTHSDPLSPDAEVTIGRALPGVQMLLLDARLRLVPRGARGELYLAGDALARGYLGRAAITARYFVANPHGRTGSRMYRTGDVVREQPDDQLEFLGRSDVQISLRGQRIEPSEVERALAADEAVDQAVVRIWKSETLGDRLIGYVVAADPEHFDRTAVLARLRTVLPPGMIPAALVPLAAIPINPSSGKTDRSALPDPKLLARPAFRPPRSQIERTVADAIAEVTGQPRIGLNDNFFELGGNSLLGVDLCQRLSERTGTPVAMSWLFTPTVRTLSAAIESAAVCATSEVTVAGSALETILPLRGNGSGTPLICLHSAVPLSWCYTGLLQYVTDRPIYGLQSPAIAAGSPRCRTVEELAEVYLHELIRLQPQGPYHLLGWSLGGQLAHALAVGLRARGHDVGLLIMLDSVAFADGAPPPQPPTVRDLVTHLQGDESDVADNRPLTLDEAFDLLAHTGGPGRGLTRQQLERLYQGYVDCVGMSARYRPTHHHGDLLYFSARKGITGELTGDIWRPYVSGEITEHSVDVVHAQMTTPEALEVIGPVLDTELKRRQHDYRAGEAI
ncbi:amino acid adenylation domain-containing protein [Aldersonia sp. NBC_00410]|uniref:amino acid adenylation domain-containing protein n=1 Tax=Aldersonia sp. NBC_00410 TaxID=2975954 RepID=UPI0022576F64|nr:amino acid adenylation domain-containing protein [Aldersonia sp. NBC_00410]MCX5045446.1 amino acid adenylation domain-containing protein [Aldersonia sp. NBC_00410]